MFSLKEKVVSSREMTFAVEENAFFPEVAIISPAVDVFYPAVAAISFEIDAFPAEPKRCSRTGVAPVSNLERSPWTVVFRDGLAATKR